MSNAGFLLIAVAGIVAGSFAVWALNRKPKTFMSSIDDFAREMKALARDPDGVPVSRRRKRTALPPGGRSGDAEQEHGRDGEEHHATRRRKRTVHPPNRRSSRSAGTGINGPGARRDVINGPAGPPAPADPEEQRP